MSAEAFPLQWPDGWPRTPPHAREGDHKFGGKVYGLTMGRARDQLIAELQRLGARNPVVSTNITLRGDGLPMATQRRIEDPGVAVYFTYRKRPMVMARDAYVSVAGNLRSLTLAISAMRQLERHGGNTMMEKAFTGFAALAPPDWKKPWRQVFGVAPGVTLNEAALVDLYRQKARNRHPDAGGSDQLMSELNVAYQEARRELGVT